MADCRIQMRIRHSSMLNMANFLQTSTEPKLVRICVKFEWFGISLLIHCRSTTSRGSYDPTKRTALSNNSKKLKIPSTRSYTILKRSDASSRESAQVMEAMAMLPTAQHNPHPRLQRAKGLMRLTPR